MSDRGEIGSLTHPDRFRGEWVSPVADWRVEYEYSGSPTHEVRFKADGGPFWAAIGLEPPSLYLMEMRTAITAIGHTYYRSSDYRFSER